MDRDTNIAHHIWTCFPDGRDPRSPHGNYPERRESRPWMEMSIRAIPGSHTFVATAAAHHGHAFARGHIEGGHAQAKIGARIAEIQVADLDQDVARDAGRDRA